jgi:hypothetical protein
VVSFVSLCGKQVLTTKDTKYALRNTKFIINENGKFSEAVIEIKKGFSAFFT